MKTRGYRLGASRGNAVRGGALLLAASVSLGATLLARPALADDRDSATVGKITLLNRKAVDAYQHLEFETAMRLLNEALDQSERAGLIQHPIRARTFVTMGIVSLGGFKQRDKAVKYFAKALQIQPEVRLSPGLANPEIQAAFDQAIADLANGSAIAELAPERALVHEPVRVGQTQKPVPITVVADKDLEASAVVLRYRSAAASSFTDLPMKKGATGAFEAAIPPAATDGEQVAYFIEARRPNGTVLVGRGSAADPIVVALARPAASIETGTRAGGGEPDKRLFFAVLGGTGFGWASGSGEQTGTPVTSSGMDWTLNGQLAPELGYLVTPRFMLGVQGRIQMVRGATTYYPSAPMPGECGEGICDPYKGAFAALLKAKWFLVDPQSAFQPYFSLSAGGGYIRHVSRVKSENTCGSGTVANPPTQPCVDSVPGGPVLFGPGVGFRYAFSDAIGMVAELGGLIGMPKFTANADLNLGLGFQF